MKENFTHSILRLQHTIACIIPSRLRQLCVLALILMGSLPAWSTDPEFIWIDKDITPESPSIRARLIYGCTNGEPSFWDDDNPLPNLTVKKNGTSIATWKDLTFIANYTDRGNITKQKKEIENKRSIDGIWASFENSEVKIIFYNPYGEGDTFYTYVEVLPLKELHSEDYFELVFNGIYVRDNGYDVDHGWIAEKTLTLKTNSVNKEYFKEGTYSRNNKYMEYTISGLPTLASNLKYKLEFLEYFYYHNGQYRNTATETFHIDGQSAEEKRHLKLTTNDNIGQLQTCLTQSITNNNVYLPALLEMKESLAGNSDHKKEYDQIVAELNKKPATIVFSRTTENKFFAGFTSANNLTATTNAWGKEVKLNWENGTTYKPNEDGRWYVFRYTTSEGIDTRTQLVALSVNETSYTDKSLDYDKDYTYLVTFLPSHWSTNPVEIADDLKETVSAKLERTFYISLEATNMEGGVQLRWENPEFGDNGKYAFEILRSKNDTLNYSTLKEVQVTDRNKIEYFYEDTDMASACDIYHYKVAVTAMGMRHISNPASGSMSGTTQVTDFDASKGAYANLVKLWWSVDQFGSEDTQYILYRRLNGHTQDEWTKIYTTTGTDAQYSFEDVSVKPGLYYEYRLEVRVSCNGSFTSPSYFYQNGFGMATGVVSGRITYGTGTAVENVKVTAVPASDPDHPVEQQMYALRSQGRKGGIVVPMDSVKMTNIFGGDKGFSAEMWVSLDKNIKSLQDESSYAEPMLLEVSHAFAFYAQRQDNGKYKLIAKVPNASGTLQAHETSIELSTHTYHHLTFAYDANKLEWRFVVAGDSILQKAVVSQSPSFVVKDVPQKKRALLFGINADTLEKHNFQGYMDELRLWKRALNDEEILRNCGRLLDGQEEDLALYYPLDENIKNQRVAYDYSRTGGVTNNMHGLIGVGGTINKHTPNANQLSNYGLTDANGNYILRNLSTGKDGMTYNITPVMGVHDFSPINEPRFISENSLVYSDVNFQDVSSFEVSGVVYYENTTYPVKGCQILIDGEPCIYNNRIVETDDNGEFTISVPIGDHYISLEKEGHVFADGGRYPADPDSIGTLHTFDRDISGLTFTDNTKVLVIGRVSGGKVQKELPIGFGESRANIGQAVIELNAGDRKMNVVMKSEGVSVSYENATVPLSYTNDLKNVNSTAVVGGGSETAVRTITITTDAKTGEFAAWLPPVQYTVKSVLVKNPNVSFENLPILDASEALNRHKSVLIKLNEDGTEVRLDSLFYNTSLNLSYRSPSQLQLTDISEQNPGLGGIGEQFYCVSKSVEEDGKVVTKTDTLELYTIATNPETQEKTVSYLTGYPCIISETPYTYRIKGFEVYENHDDETNILQDLVYLEGAVLTISNEFAGDTPMSNDETAETTVGNPESHELIMNEEGEVEYSFIGGLPNIQEPYTLGMSITYEYDGNFHSWDQNGKFYAIVLGSIPTGTNFVTKGPDKVLAVLRDPPGSNSSSAWSEGTVINTRVSDMGNFGINQNLMGTFKWGVQYKYASGVPGMYVLQQFERLKDRSLGVDISVLGKYGEYDTYKTVTTKTITTSSSPEYVGANGDLFYGLSTNLTFGEAREVGFHEVEGGAIELGLKDIISVGEEFETAFLYTQHYIESSLIPNLTHLRNGVLRPVGTIVQNAVVDTVYYVSNLSTDDPMYGTSNYDEAWGNQKLDPNNPIITDDNKCIGPSYTIYFPSDFTDGKEESIKNAMKVDSVYLYNEQIRLWEQQLANNEKVKVCAIEDGETVENVSFDAGTVHTRVQQTEDGEGVTWDAGFKLAFIYKKIKGFNLNESKGLQINFDLKLNGDYTHSSDSTQTTSTTTQYTLAESGTRDALSVDVYSIKGEASPVFRTRGGQTSCPYEGEVKTKYYLTPNNDPYTISEATMQIEKPAILCAEPVKTGVPVGGKAYFTFELQNNSEIDTDVWYSFGTVEASNKNGARVLINGTPGGKNLLIPAGQSVTQVVTIEQGDPSVLDYDSISVFLSSQCQGDPTSPNGAISVSVPISAHFVPACSEVRLQASEEVVNTITGSELELTIDGYDPNHRSLRSIQIQKKTAGSDWVSIMGYFVDKSDSTSVVCKPLGQEGSHSFKLSMADAITYPDQIYEFRAITVCDFGAGEVNNESPIITIVKDMQLPALLAMPSPSDGVYDVGDEIAIYFNEEILSGAITEVDNISVTGLLNENAVDHSVAYHAEGGEPAKTEAIIDLSRRSFAVNLWMNYSQPGTLFSHGNKENGLAVVLEEDATIITIGDSVIAKGKAIPRNTWSFINASIHYNEDENMASLSVHCAYNDAVDTLFSELPMGNYTGRGTLAFGGGLTGFIHEATLWNSSRGAAVAISEKNMTKAPYTPGLIGYWKFDEGHGHTAADVARNRHIILPNDNAWMLGSVGKALQLDGNSYASISLGACPTTDTDDYMLELWFRADTTALEFPVTIFSAGDNMLSLNVGKLDYEQGDVSIDKEVMYLIANGRRYIIPNGANCLGGAWHHISLNVLNQMQGVSTLYIDGVAMRQFDAGIIPGLQAESLILGARSSKDAANMYVYDQPLRGCFDEVRYWKGTYSAQVIRNNRYHRLQDAETGLLGYYPFERNTLDEGNQPIVEADLSDHSSLASPAARVFSLSGNEHTAATTDQAPPLKAAPVLQNVPFTFVTADRMLRIVPDVAAERIEGTTLNFKVNGIRDIHGNYSGEYKWSALVRQNPLTWEQSTIDITKESEATVQFTVSITNAGNTTENWNLYSLPSWLEADRTAGMLQPLSSTEVTFTVSSAATVGRYETIVYLIGNSNIATPLEINVKSVGDVPDWSVNPSDHMTSMNIIGRLRIDGKISENPDNMLAAFKGDTCVGVAHPIYMERYDAYYVMMTIYGSPEDNNKLLTFRAYDAETGIIHPSVKTINAVTFMGEHLMGSYGDPLLFFTTNEIEQVVCIDKGWQWRSLYVTPTQPDLRSLLAPVAGNLTYIKTRDSFSTYNEAGNSWSGGNFNMLQPGGMYKMYAAKEASFPVIGLGVDLKQHNVPIMRGWNWIGFASPVGMTVADAFALLSPEDGDIVKNQFDFAIYDGYAWEGTLQALVPGEGYIYYSDYAGTKQLAYPSSDYQRKAPAKLSTRSAHKQTRSSAYPSNMNIIALVKNGEEVMTDAKVQIYANEELRGQSSQSLTHDLHFITVQGQGSGVMLNIVVECDGSTFEVAEPIFFNEDMLLGSMQQPYVIQLDPTTSITNISFKKDKFGFLLQSGSPLRSVNIYDASGRNVYSGGNNTSEVRISMEQFASGVYLVETTLMNGRRRTFNVLW